MIVWPLLFLGPVWAGEIEDRFVADLESVAAGFEAEVTSAAERLAQRRTSESAVDGLRVERALARYDLALAERRPERALDQLGVVAGLYDTEAGRLARLYSSRHASEAELLDAQLGVALACVFRARSEGESEALVAHWRTAVELYRKELARTEALHQVRAGSLRSVSAARARLAAARGLLAEAEGMPEAVVEQHRLVEQECRQELERLERLPRLAASDRELAIAREQLAAARFFLAEAQRQPDEAAEQVRVAIGLRQKELERMRVLRQRHAVPEDDVDVAETNLLRARAYLALGEGTAQPATESLSRLLELYERRLRRQHRPELALAICWEMAFDRRDLGLVGSGASPLREHRLDELWLAWAYESEVQKWLTFFSTTSDGPPRSDRVLCLRYSVSMLAVLSQTASRATLALIAGHL